MNSLPVGLKKLDNQSLVIAWDDGVSLIYSPISLRNACPCATCKEKKRAASAKSKGLLNVLSEAETIPLMVEQMRPVGNYAYNISFSDGHSSGLFTMELLREIGNPFSSSL